MEFKYPKLKKGLSLFAIGFLLKSIGHVLHWMCNFAVIMWGESFGMDTIGGIVMTVGDILVLVGLFTAAKERRNYLTVFFMILGGYAISFWHGLFSGLNLRLYANPIGIVSKVVTFTYICIACVETSRVLKEEGITKLTKLCLPVYIGYGIFYGYSVFMLLISMFINTNQTIFGILGIGAYAGAFVGGVTCNLFFFLAVSRIKKLNLESK
ncbi:MAG: hypothetical protein E7260_09355 [Lachnospiraceae bacterium]|nr:hypothetical protein [Lachnospiraceae bacterium]